MFFRLSNEELSGWCRRVGISVNSGLDLLRVLKREGEKRAATGFSAATCWKNVAESVVQGDSLNEALEKRSEQLNDLFISMVRVGEKSGHLGETLLELADYYDQLIELKRSFWRSLILPIFELGIALFIVGIMILVLGFLPIDFDITGFGLIGVSGLIKYLVFLAVVGFAGIAAYWYMKANATQFQFVQYGINYIPKIGPIFRILALTRLTWAMYLTLRTGMDVKEALSLSFAAASYAPITNKLPIILEELEAGGNMYDGFTACHSFDDMLMLNLQTGEESGNLPEVMHKLSNDYFQQCIFRLKTVSVIGFFMVFGLVAGIIIFFIFRIAMFIGGIYSDALNMTQ